MNTLADTPANPYGSDVAAGKEYNNITMNTCTIAGRAVRPNN
jgi:hypothetical protein